MAQQLTPCRMDEDCRWVAFEDGEYKGLAASFREDMAESYQDAASYEVLGMHVYRADPPGCEYCNVLRKHCRFVASFLALPLPLQLYVLKIDNLRAQSAYEEDMNFRSQIDGELEARGLWLDSNSYQLRHRGLPAFGDPPLIAPPMEPYEALHEYNMDDGEREAQDRRYSGPGDLAVLVGMIERKKVQARLEKERYEVTIGQIDYLQGSLFQAIRDKHY